MADWSPASLAGAMGLEAGEPNAGGGGGFDAAVAGTGDALPHRGRMEAAFGQDLGFVQAHTGAAAQLAPLGAQAAARGDQVAFAEAAPSPWLVAHELTHVMQTRGAGGAESSAGSGPIAAKSTIASDDSAAEREADRVADRVAAGESAGPISAPPGPGIQRFAPAAHEKATVKGLAKTFSPDEIAAIYASNWERDFSQGHPDLANATLAWSQVKQYAAKHGGQPGPAAQVFQDAIWKVVHSGLTEYKGETSLGGYRTWEHMDAPDEAKVREKANQRWAKKSEGVAGYIMDARAHIKDQMVAAIDVYRAAHKHGAVGSSIDNWGDVEKPEGYVSPAGSTKEAPALPKAYNDERVASRDPIRGATRQQAVAAGATARGKHDAVEWEVIGQHLGRAMHAFEDFWAHSNWLELAMTTLDGGAAASNAQLMTGTFPEDSQVHALGHKILALSKAFYRDHELMLKIYGADKASTKLDSDEAAKRRSTKWAPGGGRNDRELAYGPLATDSRTTRGEAVDLMVASNNVEELVLSGEYTMADFLTNKNWLTALAHKGELLIAQGDATSGAESHGKLAKDQVEGDGHKDHASALRLATAANQMVFAPLRAIMDQKDSARALFLTLKQLDLVDTMLVAPTPTHPLWDLVKSIHGASKGKAGKK